MDDKELAIKIKNGDQNAFRQIYEQHQDLVYNICYRMSDNREEAEDISQDVFLKIYHAIGEFRGDAKLSSWIYRITVNTCLKRERRKKLEKMLSLEFLFQTDEKFQPVSPDKLADHLLEKSEKEQIVQQAIQQLPVRQKTALILQRYENLSYEEIAAAMAINRSAVESLLHRAKENFAKKLLPMQKDLF